MAGEGEERGEEGGEEGGDSEGELGGRRGPGDLAGKERREERREKATKGEIDLVFSILNRLRIQCTGKHSRELITGLFRRRNPQNINQLCPMTCTSDGRQ